MKLLKRCPLAVLLAVSALALTAVALANRNGIYREYGNGKNTAPALAMVFEGAKDGVFPWSPDGGDMPAMVDSAAESGSPDGGSAAAHPGGPDGGSPEGAGLMPEAGGTAANAPEEEAERQTAEAPEKAADGPDGGKIPDRASEGAESEASGETDPGAGVPYGTEGTSEAEAQPQTPEDGDEDVTWDFVQVDASYLDDALFIGDSRTQGLFEYGGLEDHATFFCKTSLTIYDLFKNELAFIKTDAGSQTLTQALSERQYGKIYLMLGINEMGTGTPESFFTEYAKAVMQIRQLQPDAILFVQGIMHVAAKKNASDPIFNNFNIDVRNVEIQTLEDKRDIFYLDVNEVVCDENGNLFDGWSFDQVHLKGKYYQVWKDFLLQHGIVREQEGNGN